GLVPHGLGQAAVRVRRADGSPRWSQSRTNSTGQLSASDAPTTPHAGVGDVGLGRATDARGFEASPALATSVPQELRQPVLRVRRGGVEFDDLVPAALAGDDVHVLTP